MLKFESVRFVLVGVLNTGFSYIVYAGLLYCGLNYVLANFAALILGIMFSFRTQGVLVFRNPEVRLFYRFAAGWLLIFLVNIGLIAALIRYGLNAYAAGGLALFPITLMSYLVQKFIVFGSVRPVDAAKSAG